MPMALQQVHGSRQVKPDPPIVHPIADAALLSARMRRAARGDADAQFDLGLMYATGEGVDLDYVTAHQWFNLAAMGGNREARVMRADLALDMSPAQVAEAQRRAREWRGRHIH